MHIVLFTLYQAAFSTLTSVIIGSVFAWCLASSYPRLIQILKSVLTLPFFTPSIVLILGYITLASGNGILAQVFPTYGFMGIVNVHTLFYAPFVAMLLLQGWQSIPPEYLCLSHQLGMNSFARFRFIERPLIQPYLLTAIWLVFCMSMTSFTTVLILGGGPRSTTISVALYQSLFHVLDGPMATFLTCVQIGLCLLSYGIMLILPKIEAQPTRLIPHQISSSTIKSCVTLFGTLCFLLPILVVFVESSKSLKDIFSQVTLMSLYKSIILGMWVGPLSTGIALFMLVWFARPRLMSLLGSIFFITPLTLLGFFAFWLQLQFSWVSGFVAVIILNVCLTLPFALHFLKSPSLQVRTTYKRVCQGLGMNKWREFIHVSFPLLRKPIADSLGFCAALAAGDLTALLMISDYDNPGLSALLYQQMGGYRSGEALGTAALLVLLCWGFISFFYILFKESKYVKSA